MKASTSATTPSVDIVIMSLILLTKLLLNTSVEKKTQDILMIKYLADTDQFMHMIYDYHVVGGLAEMIALNSDYKSKDTISCLVPAHLNMDQKIANLRCTIF